MPGPSTATIDHGGFSVTNIGALTCATLEVDGVPITGEGGGGVTLQQVLDAIAAHAALETTHGISAYIETLTDDANAGAARATLGLGTAAVENVGAFDAVGAAQAWVATHEAAGDPHPAYCLESDPRLSDARTPTAHTHAAADINSGTLAIARIPTGTSSSTVCIGNDARLSDARTPLSHVHAGADITTGTVAAARLPTFGSAADGIVPLSGGGSANFLRADGTWQVPPGAGGASIVKKTSDQTFNSATPADVSSLVFALTSGRYYKFEFTLIVRSDTLTVGVATSLTFPSMTRFAAVSRFAGFAADGAGAEWQGNITTSDDAVIPTATVAINTDYILTISGVAVPSANGNLQVRARTETGTTVVTVRQGSCGLLHDLGT